MQPKLGQAVQALQFIIDHPYNFSNLASPILVCVMNIIAIFFTQLAGSILCIVTNDANGVLGGFVSYAVISDLPGQYFSTLAVDEVKKELEECDDGMKLVAKRNINKYVPPTSQDGNHHYQRSDLVIMKKGEEGTHTELQEGDTAFIKSVYNGLGWIRCFQYLVLGLTHFYETFYFYFAPFIMLIF